MDPNEVVGQLKLAPNNPDDTGFVRLLDIVEPYHSMLLSHAALVEERDRLKTALNKISIWKCPCDVDDCTCVSEMIKEASIALCAPRKEHR